MFNRLCLSLCVIRFTGTVPHSQSLIELAVQSLSWAVSRCYMNHLSGSGHVYLSSCSVLLTCLQTGHNLQKQSARSCLPLTFGAPLDFLLHRLSCAVLGRRDRSNAKLRAMRVWSDAFKSSNGLVQDLPANALGLDRLKRSLHFLQPV